MVLVGRCGLWGKDVVLMEWGRCVVLVGGGGKGVVLFALGV